MYNKRLFSTEVFRNVNYKEEKIGVIVYLYLKKICMFKSIHRCLKPNSLWYIVKRKFNQRLPINVLVQLGSMKIISKHCILCQKLVENYNMHFMHLLENTERFLENLLNILDVNEYVDFENQTIEKQYITLLGCTNNTNFENIIFGKWKPIMQMNVYLYTYINFATWCIHF